MAQDVVGSNMPSLASEALKPSKAGYGQNGYHGASSDTPGENTTAGFLPGVSAADLEAAKDRLNPNRTPAQQLNDAVRNRSGKGNPAASKDFKQPKFVAPQTRTVSADTYPLSMGMAQRSLRNK